jgi:hypothetical protein
MNNLLSRRFDELLDQVKQLEATKARENDAFTNASRMNISYSRLLNWKVKAKSLIESACGKDSQHLKHFEEVEDIGFATALDRLYKMQAVFEAAKEDYQGGYLTSVRTLIQAEIFESELEQSRELLKNGYALPAAVVAGVVLETCLRDLCAKHNLVPGKVEKMNADLVKAGEYNVIVQKQVTHLASIRNSAAHGDSAAFRPDDVAAMINDIERFLAQHLN